ncbi:MAG: hypothetical protein ACXW00_00805 [Methylobacter sp.]
MPVLSKIDSIPNAIKDELIKKVLIGSERYEDIANWLLEKHGVKASRSSVWRFGKNTNVKFKRLVNLGMPINEIVKHRRQIEALGIEVVAQQLLDKLTEKNGQMFAYLDEM